MRTQSKRSALAIAALVFLACGGEVAGADPVFVRMWEEAQKSRPAELSSAGRIAPEGEAGRPMRIRGRAYLQDGETPAAGVIVFAYQTDAAGLYHQPGARTWRLRGWARTDSGGRFELLTIRPGSYPNGNVPAHVHFTMEGPRLTRRWTGDLEFADDPLLTDAARSRSAEQGRFGSIRTVRRDPRGVELVEIDLRASDANTF
jgi:protocatechuate 3,4-dioxygenase, beta subunit